MLGPSTITIPHPHLLSIEPCSCPIVRSPAPFSHSPTTYPRARTDASFAAIIYCFLSTCVGLEIRRSDILEAFTPSAILASQGRNARSRNARGEYEMDTMTNPYDRLGGAAMSAEEIEMMRRNGPGRFY